jgi:hypothetical protein
MKKWLFLSQALITGIITISLLPANNEEIGEEIVSSILDEILVAIYTQKQGIIIILRSDLRPNLDGSERSLRKIILEHLMLLEAETLHITISEDEAERHLGQIQKEHKLTRKALERLFSDCGYTYEEGREQLRRTQIIGMLVEHKIRSHLIINETDIIAYFDNHPEYNEASYTLAHTFIPHEKATREEIEDLARQNKVETIFKCDDEFVVQENELADERRFIIDAPLGSMVEIEESDEGFDLTILKAKTSRALISFEERKDDIEYLLRKERFDMSLREYEDELLAKATLRFTYEDDKKEILKESI